MPHLGVWGRKVPPSTMAQQHQGLAGGVSLSVAVLDLRKQGTQPKWYWKYPLELEPRSAQLKTLSVMQSCLEYGRSGRVGGRLCEDRWEDKGKRRV